MTTLRTIPLTRPLQRAARGGVLLEIVISVALFGGAAAFTLAAVSSVFTTLDQTRKHQQAVDLARSRMAELEAGLISIAELNADVENASPRGTSSDRTRIATPPDWIVDAKVRRSEFTGLSLVELTVIEKVSPARDDAVRYTLRQLVPLREVDVQMYEQEEGLEAPDE